MLSAACTLSAFACTRDRAQEIVQAVIVATDISDTAYVTVNGHKEVLLGFDLTKDTAAIRRPKLVDEIASYGGNLLRVDSTLYSPEEWQRTRVAAGEKEMVLDRGDLPTQLRSCRSAKEFNKSLLTGHGAVVFTEFNQRNLNAIRAVRTVERYVKMHELMADSTLLSEVGNTGSLGAGDGEENYAIYTPSTGNVNISLDEGQFPRRVTVVGHLGTQRSEILRPPYDRSFTVLSNDDNGGWLIITRLEE